MLENQVYKSKFYYCYANSKTIPRQFIVYLSQNAFNKEQLDYFVLNGLPRIKLFRDFSITLKTTASRHIKTSLREQWDKNEGKNVY